MNEEINNVPLIGSQEALMCLSRDMEADAGLKGISLGPITPRNSRRVDMAEMLFTAALHVPVGLTVHFLHDWLKEWSRKRKLNVQPDAEQGK